MTDLVDQIMTALPDRAEPETDLFRRWNMGDLLAEPDEFQWLIRGLFAEPTYGQLAGEMKTLKSYMATFIMVGLASGTPIFDHFRPPAARPVVAYVGEGGRRLFTRRIRRIAEAMGLDPGRLPITPTFDVAPIPSLRFQESLARDLVEIEPGLVLLDPFYAYHGLATKAADLHQEGALLNQVSGPCMEAGASLLIVNHYNQTGSGAGLKRITMAGSGEWADSWLLVAHREDPDVEGGKFRLSLEIGSRQWGGNAWELDLDIGRFDVDLGAHDGAISWSLRRPSGKVDVDKTKVLDFVRLHPFQHTKEEIATGVGGNVRRMRGVVDSLVEDGRIKAARTSRIQADGRQRPVWTFGPSCFDVQGETETDDEPL